MNANLLVISKSCKLKCLITWIIVFNESCSGMIFFTALLSLFYTKTVWIFVSLYVWKQFFFLFFISLFLVACKKVWLYAYMLESMLTNMFENLLPCLQGNINICTFNYKLHSKWQNISLFCFSIWASLLFLVFYSLISFIHTNFSIIW